MRVTPRAILVSLAASTALVAHTLWADSGLPQRRRAAAELAEIEARASNEEARAARLSERIDGLRARGDVRERTVRHELGHLRDGEVVLDLAPDQKE